MKLSRKQIDEIDFLCKEFGVLNPTQQEKEEYIGHVVYGNNKNDNNRIFQAKRRLDMNIKMWREDITTGILGVFELEKDFGYSEFGRNIIRQMVKSVTPKYRREVLTKKNVCATILALTNFGIYA